MNSAKSGTKTANSFPSFMVQQTPRYDTVYSRKSHIYRPSKRKKKPRYL